MPGTPIFAASTSFELILGAPFDGWSIRAILLDIEGTTTPVDFVHGTLFSFARARIEEFLRLHYERDDVRTDLEGLRQQRAVETERPSDLPPWRSDSPLGLVESAAAYARWLMDRDSKSTALKSLQGKIWEAGYASGELRGQVYPDVPPAFQRWHAQNKDICIFSSGSVQAQQLLFANTTAGDLTKSLRAFFDTRTGPKQDAQSYRAIARTLGFGSHVILFVSDAVVELDAAHRAGMRTALCLRDGAGCQSEALHPTIRAFDDLFPQTLP